MPKIDTENLPVKTGSIYPAKFAAQMAGRSSVNLGDAGGLTQYGVKLTMLEPGAKSSLRHWHENEDEFVMVLEGALTLEEDTGETLLQPGDCAAFPAGNPVGHCIINKSDAPGRFLVVGTRASSETAHYTSEDMMVRLADGKANFTKRDGTPLEEDQ